MNYDFHIAISANAAIEYLKNNKYDLIFLDHDLGGLEMIDSSFYNTGYTVAKFMKENNVKGRVVIHSLNPSGAQNIKFLLKNAKVIPFTVLNIEEEI
jgi:CheY-like chemotaxis protein